MNQANDNYLYSQQNNINNYPTTATMNNMNNENSSPMIDDYETHQSSDSPLINMNPNSSVSSPMGGMDDYSLPPLRPYNAQQPQPHQHYALPPVNGNPPPPNLDMNGYNTANNSGNGNNPGLKNGGANGGGPNTKKFSFVNVTLNPQQKNGTNGLERSINYKQKRKIINKTQYNELMRVFQITEKPSHDERARLARLLSMSVREVQVWFQNRRAKNKKGARNRSSTPPFISYKPNASISNSNCSSEVDSDKSSKGSPTMQKMAIYPATSDSNNYITTTFSYSHHPNTPSTSNNPLQPKILPNPNQLNSSPIISPSKTGSGLSSDFPYLTPINWNKNPPQTTTLADPNTNGTNNPPNPNNNNNELNNKFLDYHQNYPTPQPSPPHERDPNNPNNEGKQSSRGRPRGHFNVKKEGLNNESTSPEVMAAAEALTSLSALFMSGGNVKSEFPSNSNNSSSHKNGHGHHHRNINAGKNGNSRMNRNYSESQDNKNNIKPYPYTENQDNRNDVESTNYTYPNNSQDYNIHQSKQPIHYNEKPDISNSKPLILPQTSIKDERYSNNNGGGNSSSNSSSSSMNSSSKRQRTTTNTSSPSRNSHYYNPSGSINNNNNLDNDYDDYNSHYHKSHDHYKNTANTTNPNLSPYQGENNNMNYSNNDSHASSYNGNYDDQYSKNYPQPPPQRNSRYINSDSFSDSGNRDIVSPRSTPNINTTSTTTTNNNNVMNGSHPHKPKSEKELYHKPIKYDTRSKSRSKSDAMVSLPKYQDQSDNNTNLSSSIPPPPISNNSTPTSMMDNPNDSNYSSNHHRLW